MFEGNSRTKMLMMMTGIIMFGSIWGLLECSLGGIKAEIFGLPISMGAVMAGLFGIGIMALSRKIFRMIGVSLAVAVVAGILRLFAPVGSCVICAGIAIISEGVIFEIIVNRKFILRSITGAEKDIHTLVFAGAVTGFLAFSGGYILTQLLTPLFTEGIFLSLGDLWDIMPLIMGRSFYATLLGGMSMPAIMLVDLFHMDLDKRTLRSTYFAGTAVISIICWTTVIFILY